METLTLEKRVAELEKRLVDVKDILTIEEASKYTGLSKSYMYKLTSQHLIPYYKPLGKFIYFEKADIDIWLRQNRISSVIQLEDKVLRYKLSRGQT